MYLITFRYEFLEHEHQIPMRRKCAEISGVCPSSPHPQDWVALNPIGTYWQPIVLITSQVNWHDNRMFPHWHIFWRSLGKPTWLFQSWAWNNETSWNNFKNLVYKAWFMKYVHSLVFFFLFSINKHTSISKWYDFVVMKMRDFYSLVQ